MYANWASDPTVTRYLSWPTHASEEVSRLVLADWVRHYAEPDYYHWAIVFEGQAIGSIAAFNQNDAVGKAEIGYCLGQRWWRRGLMTEAVQAVIRFLLDEVGYQRIEARHDPNNPDSGAVMRKCGMMHEGTLRRSDRNNQGLCDAAWYAILKTE